LYGRVQSHGWTKLKIERLKIMSRESTVQLKAMIKGFEEVKFDLIIRSWEKQ